MFGFVKSKFMIAMKKLFSNVLLATALLMGGGALLSSCSDDDGPNPPVPGGSETSKFSQCVYYGDEHQSKTGRYELLMFTGTVDNSGKPTSAGNQYIIQLYSTVAADPTNAAPAAGTYLYDTKNSYAVNTISAEGSKIWKYNDSGNKTALSFTDMSLTITGQGVSMNVEATVTFSDGSKVTVTGKDFNFTTQSGSEINSDVNVTGGEYAVMIYFGDALKAGNTVYYLAFPNADGSEEIDLMLYGPATVGIKEAAIPTGEIPFVAKPGNSGLAPGELYEDGSIFGSYYLNAKDEKYGLIESGTVRITEAGQGEFKIEVNTKSTNGYTIAGSVQGPVYLQNKTAYSTLIDDHEVDFSNIENPTAAFYGQLAETTTGAWLISLPPSANKPGSEGVDLQLFVASTTSKEIPTGTFTTSNKTDANTLYFGYVTEEGKIGGSMYYTSSEQQGYVDDFAPFAGGQVTIEAAENDQYKITLAAIDDANNNINGTWTGKLTFVDKTAKASTASVKTANPTLKTQEKQVTKRFATRRSF